LPLLCAETHSCVRGFAYLCQEEEKMKYIILFLIVVSSGAFASGHGPLFGYATPTNSKGEWSFDAGFFSRAASDPQFAARGLIGYGFTPHVMLQFSAPALLANSSLPPKIGRAHV